MHLLAEHVCPDSKLGLYVVCQSFMRAKPYLHALWVLVFPMETASSQTRMVFPDLESKSQRTMEHDM